LRILTLRDATGEIDVTLPSGASPLGDTMPDLAVGQAIQVTGAVDQYKGTSQISLGRASDLAVLDETIAIAPMRRLGDLSAADVDSLVQVEGVIVEVSPFSAGIKFRLDDGSGKVTLLLWQDLYDSLAERDALAEGAMIRVQGQVAEYRGELEIMPETPSDVTVLIFAEQPSRAQSVVERELGDLTADDVGLVVAVEGVLQSLRSFSAGVKGTLAGDTGMVTLLLWQDVYDGLAEPATLTPGAVLRVEGEVSEYKGELEVIPQSSADVMVVGKVELPSQERAVGQITADDVGQTVQVAARIVEVIPFSKGTKYVLDDGRASIILLLWQNIYDQLDDPDALSVGAQVSVRGEIAEYEGELEIIPQVPADVAVTSAGETETPTPTVQPTVEATTTPEPTTEPTATPATEPTAEPTPSPTSPPTPTSIPAVEIRSIGGITTADVGSTLSIAQAGIADVIYFSRGVKYTLIDGSGSIILLVWQNVVEEIDDRYDLVPGSQVEVTGQIDEYQGDLEIVPQAGSDVVLLAPGERLPIEERSVGDVSVSDEGRIFVVEGTVARTESNKWLKAWLNDGTGEIIVFVPERAVEYLPAGIGAGVRLRVIGAVDIYQGELEIIPLAAADVEVR
jgi:DNA/RNA endonuclease YhcR with UshA esterase domain